MLKKIFFSFFKISRLFLVRITGYNLVAKRRLFIIYYHKINYDARPFFGRAIIPEIFESQIRFLKKYYEIIDFQKLADGNPTNSSKKDLVILTFDDGYRDNYLHAYPILKKYCVPATIFLVTDYIDSPHLLWHDRLAWILYNGKNLSDFKKKSINAIPHEIVTHIHNFYLAEPHKRFENLFVLATILKTLTREQLVNVLDLIANKLKVEKWPGYSDRAMLSWEEVKEMSVNGISFGSHTMSHPVLSRIDLSEANREIV